MTATRASRACAYRRGAAEYEAAVRVLRATGWTVYRLSQARASRQTPGLPDLWAFHPVLRLELTVEVKSGAGRPTPEQEEFAQFRALCQRDHVIGGRDAVLDYLARHGLARRVSGPAGWVLMPPRIVAPRS